MELSLIPIEDLIKEIESRCSCFIAAYELQKDKDTWMTFKYGKGHWFQAVRLSSVLNNDILNNWSGELRTLQRLNEDDEES